MSLMTPSGAERLSRDESETERRSAYGNLYPRSPIDDGSGQLPHAATTTYTALLGAWRRAAASRAGESPRRSCLTGPRLVRQATSRGARGTACPRSRSLASRSSPGWLPRLDAEPALAPAISLMPSDRSEWLQAWTRARLRDRCVTGQRGGGGGGQAVVCAR